MNTTTSNLQRDLPSEILHHVFSYLSRKDVLQCTCVSRLWHSLAEPYLHAQYCMTGESLLQPPLKRHHIRKISVDDLVSTEAVLQFVTGADQDDGTRERGCPKLRTLALCSRNDNALPFYDLFSRLPRLTDLELHTTPQINPFEIDLAQLFALLPDLLHLRLQHFKFKPWTHLDNNAPAGSTDKGFGQVDCHRAFPLRSFRHDYFLFLGIDPVFLLSLMPNLRQLFVQSSYYFRNLIEDSHYDAIQYAKALHQFCPWIEDYTVADWLPLCLFLPRSVASAPLSTELTTRKMSMYQAKELSLDTAPDMEIINVLPRLKRLQTSYWIQEKGARYYSPTSFALLSSQDLSRVHHLNFLEYLDISNRRAPSDSGIASDLIRFGYGQQPISSLDILAVLECCPHLKAFIARGREITIEDLMQRRYLIKETMSISDEKITPWACRHRLEKLVVGFRISGTHAKYHRSVWAHLAQLRRLKTLFLSDTTLFPAISHGINCTAESWTDLESFGIGRSPWPLPSQKTARWMGRHWKGLIRYIIYSSSWSKLIGPVETSLRQGASERLSEHGVSNSSSGDGGGGERTELSIVSTYVHDAPWFI